MEGSSSEEASMLKKIENYVFDLREKIGEGSFSRVYKGTNIHNNATVAVKKIRVSDVKSKIARRLLEWEVNTLRQVTHPNIIHCLDIHFSINNCYIITEFCEGGNLYELLQKSGPLQEPSAAKIILAVVEALEYLSSLSIIHRDIKISNIFVAGGQYKVGDFGFAIKATANFRDVTIGSPIYMSPEGLIHNMYGPKTDVWALGILIYEILHGTTPLQNCKSEEELRKKVLEPPEIKASVSSQLRELILGCLRPVQSQRLSIKDITQSNYIRKIRMEAQKERLYEKDLSATNKSTCNSLCSTASSSHFAQISDKCATALVNYCRLTLKVAQIAKPPLLQKCLLWMTKNLVKARINIKSSSSSGAHIHRLITELKEAVIKEYGTRVGSDFKMSQMVVFCGREENKGKFGGYFRALGRQSELLLRSMQRGCIQQYSNSSSCSQYLQSHLFP